MSNQLPIYGLYPVNRGNRFRSLEPWYCYRAGTVFEVGDRLDLPGRPTEYELIPVGVYNGQSFALEVGELLDVTRFEREKRQDD